MSKTHIYHVWQSLRMRCTNPRNCKYSRYGGRGITFDKKWEKFEGFLEDMYESYLEHFLIYGRKNTSLDRIDVNGDYCKENCRWATMKEQSRNKSVNIYVFVNGEKILAREASEKYNIPYTTITSRVYVGKVDISDLIEKYH